MQIQLFTIYDKKAQYHAKPFTCQNTEIAIRTLKNTYSDPQNSNIEFVKNPEDFTLYLVAEFNDATGEITPKKELIQELISFSSPTIADLREASAVKLAQ